MGEDGTIAAQGSFQDESVQAILRSRTFSQQPKQYPDDGLGAPVSAQLHPRTNTPLISLPVIETYIATRRQLGDSTVYKFYLASAGWKPATIFVASMIVFAFCDSFPCK